MEYQVETTASDYHWLSASLKNLPAIKALQGCLDDEVELFMPVDCERPDRLRADGIWLLSGTIDGQPVAVGWWDFRVKGGSFGRSVCRRFLAFLRAVEQRHQPLLLVVNSLGLRFMEGRTIFADVFGLIPALLRFKRRQLLVTACQGRCLGFGALVFGLGHYRLAAGTGATLSLTGPEVFQLFFGQRIAFSEVAATEAEYHRSGLIHELPDRLGDMMMRAAYVLKYLGGDRPLPAIPYEEVAPGQALTVSSLLQALGGRALEVFPGYDSRLQAFVAELGGRRLGVLLNPPGQVNNMFAFRSLVLYREALQLFRALRLPLLVLLDTPGVDPRFDGQNQRVLEQLLSVTEEVINYPYRKMGVVIGRGFGGANSLGMPKVYGAEATYGLAGLQLGVMHHSIIEQLLSGSAPLLAQWNAARAEEKDDCSDVVEAGILDGIISIDGLAGVVMKTLFATSPPPLMEVG
ncbi:hypothetical protein CAI21_19270 [Alkalilimnicola ehrlichii]|uniref:Acetyl-coenzyme A carboxylase carboxyl transferase subunit beta domain-containing protein n=1 Tax=Alkalilimnicola ehrlichii TaxID=351052 RepID=A0A3E0WHW8_9GAMM|nr:carboxyl transferase domain-containing protein [Alkalilimnicola ehrlichii]RFA25376.1 hypothetical protein CAI21_19270 [Alkalilimnicola ehrlichii]RFA32552.1 hypothetical protein CAL65_19535 [Alkalilimnicola ehrlichii]